MLWRRLRRWRRRWVSYRACVMKPCRLCGRSASPAWEKLVLSITHAPAAAEPAWWDDRWYVCTKYIPAIILTSFWCLQPSFSLSVFSWRTFWTGPLPSPFGSRGRTLRPCWTRTSSRPDASRTWRSGIQRLQMEWTTSSWTAWRCLTTCVPSTSPASSPAPSVCPAFSLVSPAGPLVSTGPLCTTQSSTASTACSAPWWTWQETCSTPSVPTWEVIWISLLKVNFRVYKPRM